MTRRDLLKTGAAAATSHLLLVNPRTAFSYQANSAVRLGLLGCGNRGTAVATSFLDNTTTRIVALADIFPDQLATARTHFDQHSTTAGHPTIDGKLLFHGPDAFQQIAAAREVDLIQISTPPFFHVGHLAAAVSSGKHVYCEKPVGIDVAQARQALEVGRRVGPRQSVDIGFQVRSAPPIAEVVTRVQGGALGKIASVVANYNAPASTEKVRPGATADEHRLRNWLWDRALSGDILVEQNIHIIDLANWTLGAHPLKAAATGGRSVLTHAGDCWDNYQIDYTYPNGVHLSFSSTQFGDNDATFDAGLHLFGSDGTADAPYSGPARITGKHAWPATDAAQQPSGPVPSPPAQGAHSGTFASNGAFSDNLAAADREKERSFIASIVSGPTHNQIAAGVETALSCMLGRMSGLTGREVTWDDLLAHGETYQLGMDLKQFA